jgi:hypothetical protein
MYNDLVYHLGKEIIKRGTTIHGQLKDIGLDMEDTHHNFMLNVNHNGLHVGVWVCLDGDTYETHPCNLLDNFNMTSSAFQ